MQMAAQGDGSPLGSLGPDPLEATESEFVAQLRGHRARIKALLLDQSVLRGMGNIYTDESLWRARINPMRLASSLKEADLRQALRAVQTILKEAIRLRGSSISDYVDCSGERGEFQLQASRVPARRKEVRSLQGAHPPGDRRGTQQPFLPALPASPAGPQTQEVSTRYRQLPPTEDQQCACESEHRGVSKPCGRAHCGPQRPDCDARYQVADAVGCGQHAKS